MAANFITERFIELKEKLTKSNLFERTELKAE